MNLNEELADLKYYLKKKKITYSEFNQIIGNYFVKEYEELEDNYYLIKVIQPSSFSEDESVNYYTDYIEVIY